MSVSVFSLFHSPVSSRHIFQKGRFSQHTLVFVNLLPASMVDIRTSHVTRCFLPVIRSENTSNLKHWLCCIHPHLGVRGNG